MAKRAVILILAIAIILQNTCLMGAAGRSVVFRFFDKGCRMCCRSCLNAGYSSRGDGLKSCNMSIEGGNNRVICHYQFETGDMAGMAAGVPTRQAYPAGDCRLKFIFLDPPIKPPSTDCFC